MTSRATSTDALPVTGKAKLPRGSWQSLAVATIVLMSVVRFVGLGSAPAGLYLDEAAGAANIICVADEGRGEQGGRLPLFFPEFPGTGTFFTPTYIYSGVIWSTLFDTSVISLRAHAAFYSVLAILGVFLIARRFTGKDGALLAALAAAVSPWSFHYARIAWDPALMPAFLLFGLLLYFSRSRWSAAASGLLLAAAMYTYPTARLHVPLLLPLLALIMWKLGASWRRAQKRRMTFIAVQGGVLAIALVPLVILTLDGTLGSRAASLAITNREWLMSEYGAASAGTILQAFVTNLAKHLSPEFLLFRGDENLRHGSQLVGQLSPVDLLALLSGAMLAVLYLRDRAAGDESSQRSFWLLLLALYGALSAIGVSSLSWEAMPHATRSLAAWPFVSLLSGCLLWRASLRWRSLPYVAVVTAIVFSAIFLNDYFRRYGPASADAFDSALRREAELARSKANWEELERFAGFYPQPALRYYFMHYRGLSCSESAALLQVLR